MCPSTTTDQVLKDGPRPAASDLLITPATLEVIGFLASLIASVRREGAFSRLQEKATEAHLAARIENDRAFIEVAYLEGMPVGFFDAEVVGDRFFLNLLAVDRRYRGGVGHALLARVEQIAKELSSSTIALHSLPVPQCAAAHRLYLRNDFKITGLVRRRGVTFLKFEKVLS